MTGNQQAGKTQVRLPRARKFCAWASSPVVVIISNLTQFQNQRLQDEQNKKFSMD